jgi:BlaI family transcriptional regulator, penicillinase repressor
MGAQQLPDAELEVMTCLWQGGPETARSIRESLRKQRPMTHASVCTLLKRLEAKGYVAREKGAVGKAFVYRARVKPARTYKRILGDLLDRLFRGSGLALVASLLENRPLSAGELQELEKMLADLRKRQAEKSGGKPDAPEKKSKRRESNG